MSSSIFYDSLKMALENNSKSAVVGPPPYYSNPGKCGCGPACWRMALEHFRPDQNWSFDIMNTICHADADQKTWIYSAILETARLNFRLTLYDDFESQKFNNDPDAYIRNNIYDPHRSAKAFEAVKIILGQKTELPITLHNRTFLRGDIRSELDRGRLTIVQVDSHTLYRRKLNNANGHFLLVYGYQGDKFIYHDPDRVNPNPDDFYKIRAMDLSAASCGIMASIGL